ncbi:MAG: hypothetical protein PHP28_11585 [Actinomycetota bacterium]|nr:hypothetical protein [Actinomycetota bacterium]MDD5666435.1 hypothetical protein [Actinomycetota bacterium]
MPGDFLSGVERSNASIGDLSFKLPVIIKEARIISAVFPASAKKLRALIPDKNLVPAQLLPGMGLVQLTAYEYSDTDMGPFNEFSVVIPLYMPGFPKLPFYNLNKARTTREVHNFLLHRAATSETAVRILGEHHLWPEFPASIEFSEDEGWLTCEWKEGDDLICLLRGRKIPAKHMGVVKIFIFTPRHPHAQRADINPDQSVTTRGSENAELSLGSSHPIAAELSETLASTRARMYTYGPRWQLIAYGPQPSRGDTAG